MKTWNIGNTTVRNPERIRHALQVFADHFVGHKWDADAEERFYRALVEAEVYAPQGGAVKATSTGQAGRKWASAFKQLGFARVGRRAGLVELTAVGEELLRDELSTEDVFLRQLLKYHLPSPLEPRTRSDGFDVYPFRLTLRILNNLRLAGSPGITKEELGLFVVTTMLDSRETDATGRILTYRNERNDVTGRVAKKRFYARRRLEVANELYGAEEQAKKYELLTVVIDHVSADLDYLHSAEADELLSEIVRSGKGFRTAKAQALKRKLRDGVRTGSPRAELWEMVSGQYFATRAGSFGDYADTAARYFTMSGLFSLAGSKLVFKESLLPLVESFAAEVYPSYDESNYLEAFYDPNLPTLPSDNIHVLEAMVTSLRVRQVELADSLGMSAPAPIAVAAVRPAELKRQMDSLRRTVTDLRELQFYREQARQSQEIVSFFDEIKSGSLFGGEAYLPAFYEWNIWRVFLAINEIRNSIPETRGFRIDEEMYPVHHAAGGRPDMLFEYDHCLLVVEASLSTGENQWSQEQEPVQRHVKDVMRSCPGKRVCGIFVAPRIDPNTAVNFRRAYAWLNDKEVPLDIVPLTTDQLTRILAWQADHEYDTAKLLALVLDLAAAKDNVGDGVEWLAVIGREIELRVGTRPPTASLTA
ncbi:MAG: AlwI family type II restriction endonuclease [Thermoleophilia bacterium]